MKKTLALITLALLSVSAWAGTIQLGWDPSPSGPLVGGYYLYGRTNAFGDGYQTNSAFRLDCGTNLTATLSSTNLIGSQWQFAVGCYGNDTNRIEAPLSNILPVEFPAPASNMRTIAVQWSPIVNGINWTDVGFFRIKVGP